MINFTEDYLDHPAGTSKKSFFRDWQKILMKVLKWLSNEIFLNIYENPKYLLANDGSYLLILVMCNIKIF